MYRSHIFKGLIILSAFAFLAVAAIPVMASEVTITGEVNDNSQLVTDNQIYDIADTEKGSELAGIENGTKVKVTGTLEETGDMKVITVISFEVVSE